MKIKLLENIKREGYSKILPHKYYKNDILEVIPASNLPDNSEIKFWINQDGWDDDSYGFPVYVGQYTEILYAPIHLKKWEMEFDYGGDDMSEYYIVLAHTRDSDTLEESNWESFLRDHPENYDEDTKKGILVANFGHWACGWFELILVHESDYEFLEEMDEIRKSLDDYPVYDEDNYSMMESESQYESVRDEIEYYIRNNVEEEIEQKQIDQMVYWYVQECNSMDSTPNDQEIEELVERIKYWKTCPICVEYNNTHSNGEGYRKESYDERFDACGCQMKLL